MAMGDTGFTEEVKNIQRQMARARLEIHQDVGGAVDGVQLLTDWRTIVRSRPWLSLTVAAALGYVAIPRRSQQLPRGGPVESAIGPYGASAAPAASGATTGRGAWRPLGAALGLITPILVRAAQTYALNYLESWLAEPGDRQARPESDRPGDKTDGRTQASPTAPVRFREHP